MKNRKLILIVSLVLAMTMSLGGTLAYLTDTDSEVNTMVLGNVDIEQHEYQRAKDKDGSFKIDEIDERPSYVLEDFKDDKPLLPAIVPNGGTVNGITWDYDSIPVRMSQVGSHGGASVFNTPNAVDKFVTVENSGKTDAYVRTLIALEVGNATLENEKYPNQPLIATEIRAKVAAENLNGDFPWTIGFCDYVEIKGNNYLVYELIYTGAKKSDGTWVHANGILPAGATTYPSLCQVYMASWANNKEVTELDGNANSKYDILVLSQAIQAAGWTAQDGKPVAKVALDNGFGEATKKNIQKWFQDDDSTDELPTIETVKTLKELQARLDDVPSDTTIVLGADIVGDVTYTQESEYTVLVDGNGYSFTGVFSVNGGSKGYETAKLIIKDVDFIAKNGAASCILFGGTNESRYVRNVIISNCTFSDNDGTVNCAAVRSSTGGDKYVTIENCTVNKGMHSLCQVANIEEGLKITGCKVYSKNGAGLNQTENLEMSGCTFDVQGYAVRFGVDNETETPTDFVKTFQIKDSTLKSACAADDDAVIVFRHTATNATLTLENVTLDGKVEFLGKTTDTTINIK